MAFPSGIDLAIHRVKSITLSLTACGDKSPNWYKLTVVNATADNQEQESEITFYANQPIDFGGMLSNLSK